MKRKKFIIKDEPDIISVEFDDEIYNILYCQKPNFKDIFFLYSFKDSYIIPRYIDIALINNIFQKELGKELF
jgi:pheromone shutdown protein TraB